MSTLGTRKTVVLNPNGLQLTEEGSTALGGIVRKPKITLFANRMNFECCTITREAFLHIVEAWRDFLDEPDKGREL